MLQRFKILIGLCVFLLVGILIIQTPLFQPTQSMADETPTETPIPTSTPIPTNTLTPTPTSFHFGCEGLTCKKLAGSSSNSCDPAHVNLTCDSTTWSPNAPDWYCNASCGLGTDYRSCLCSGGAQDCCPQCSSGYGCNSTLQGGSCCVSKAPDFPTITEIKDGYGQIVYPPATGLEKLQTKIVTIKWSFTDTGDGCGKSWGYLCGGNNNSFKIRVNSKSDTIAPSEREYTTTGNTLIPNNSSLIKVCANNGDDDIESCSSLSIVKAIPTGYIAGYLGEYDGTNVTYGVNNTGLSLKLYADDNWTDLPSFIETSCSINAQSRYSPIKPNTPIYSPKPIGLSYACTITYNSDKYFNEHGGDIPEDELKKKFYLGPESTIGYDNKLYCVDPIPRAVDTYAFDNCDICLGQPGCTSTEAMSCKDINPPLIPPHGNLTPTPILEWTSAGNCRDNNFTGVLNFKQHTNPNAAAPDTVRYKNVVFQINQYNTFFKQKNTAFQSHETIENHIPASNNPFNLAAAEDDGESFMMIGEPDAATSNEQEQYEHLSGTGLILSTINNGSASLSKLGWKNNTSYAPVTRINANDYYDYTKARKKYKTITNIRSADIANRGCYIHEGDFTYENTIANPYEVAPHPIVFISKGTVTIKSNLNPPKSIIFIAPKIVFNNDVTSAKGVFIGNEIKLVSETNNIDPSDPDYLTTIVDKPLLITGNLVALNTSIKYWQRKLEDNRKPSLFVKFDIKQYTDGMPCLGVSKYKWNQLQ